jgi:alpha-D-ribose 1-methylphosphonate 5-triphosphate synthase subunit PhnH
MSQPILSVDEARTQQTFRALMWALSYPGRPQALPFAGRAALLAIADTLLDLETSYYCADPELGTALARSEARPLAVAHAAYQFYPLLLEHMLSLLATAPVGSHAYPDEGATLIIGCELGAGQMLRLSGPGIPGATQLRVAGVPPQFWALREQACAYPLGWDLLLLAGDQLVGLPRSSRVEVL